MSDYTDSLSQEMVTTMTFARVVYMLRSEIESSKIALKEPIIARNMLKLLDIVEIQEKHMDELEERIRKLEKLSHFHSPMQTGNGLLD